MVGSGARVSISATTRKMIQNIKETTAGNYSEDEIIAMLHECNMDPDETAQRLLLQGIISTFSALFSLPNFSSLIGSRLYFSIWGFLL